MKNSKLKRILVIIGFLGMLTMPATAYPYNSSNTTVSYALDYLGEQQQADGSISDFSTSAWVVMSIAACGQDPHNWSTGGDSIVDYLRNNTHRLNTTKATDVERFILAIIASGDDPRDFNGMNYVEALENLYDGAQIGETSLLNDDFWGILALISAGVDRDSQIIQNVTVHIKDKQNSDGGWSWGVGGVSDVDDTAAAIMALSSAGEDPGSTNMTAALDYLKGQQTDTGGFLSWGSTNSGTDSWAINAIVAAGGDPISTEWTDSTNNRTPVDDLLSFQNVDGSFNWTHETPSNKELMTGYAIPALLGKPYPVAIQQNQQTREVHIYVRVEGKNETLWRGNVTVTNSTIVDDSNITHYLSDPTALGALDEASGAGGFTYVVKDSAYGMYVYSVDGEVPEGFSGWMYRIDYHSPMVGADSFILDETSPPDPPHKEVLWYYGNWGEYPLRLDVDKTIVDACDVISVNVSYFNESSWLPLANATVYADADYLTDVNGGVNISIADSGNHSIFAEKPGYIRSDKITVEVEEITTTTTTTAPTTTSIKKSSGGSSGGRSSGGGFSAVPIRKETCFDGLMNCHDGACEEEADCGGPCEPCPSCEDGIQNQGEEGIDCGGPCTPCFTTTTASIPITSTMLTTSSSVTTTSTSTVTTTTTLVVTTTSIPAQGIGGAIAAFTAENLGVITPMLVGVMLLVSAVFYKKRTRLFK